MSSMQVFDEVQALNTKFAEENRARLSQALSAQGIVSLDATYNLRYSSDEEHGNFQIISVKLKNGSEAPITLGHWGQKPEGIAAQLQEAKIGLKEACTSYDQVTMAWSVKKNEREMGLLDALEHTQVVSEDFMRANGAQHNSNEYDDEGGYREISNTEGRARVIAANLDVQALDENGNEISPRSRYGRGLYRW